MALSPEQLAARGDRVSASFTPYLMAGKTDRIRSEWMKLVGHPAHEEPDWSEMWNLRYGEIIEPLALDFHERKTGHALTRRGEVVVHPSKDHVVCTLDAYRAEHDLVLDCKAWSSWQKVDYICSFLTPQMIVQRRCVGADRAAILLVHGGGEPVEYPIEWTPDYEASVWERIEWFWSCVESLTPPVEIPADLAPVAAVKEVDMHSSNAWAAAAGDWLFHRDAARKFDEAAKELKSHVPADVKRAYGHSVEIVRDRANRMSVRAL